MGVFHELDLLVLRPFVKKKINLRTPHQGHARQSFLFQKIAGTLKMNIKIKFEIKSCLIFFKNSQKWPKQFLI